MSDKKVIFAMEGVSKIYPPKKQVLKNIWLSFYYGAKIGVLGLNGSGKSSLLKIIAGLDTNYQGNVTFDKEYKIGYLAQEPELDENKTVKECVQEGVQHIVDVVKAYEDISAKLAEPMDDDAMMKSERRDEKRANEHERNSARERAELESARVSRELSRE